MRILLINDNSAHPNWGAQATPFALQEILAERMPVCEIRKITWDWIRMDTRVPKTRLLGTFEVRPNAIPHFGFLVAKLTRSKDIYPRVRDDFDWFADRWAAGRMGKVAKYFVELVRWADVVVYNGENNLFRNTVEGCRSVFLMYLVKTRLGKPACSVNHTVHITKVRPIMKAMIESVFPSLDLVISREPKSYRALQELGVTNARSGADPVFSLKEKDDARRRIDGWLEENGLAGKPFACLSASGLPASRPRGENDGAVSALARKLRSTLKMPVVLVARDPGCQFLKEVAHRTGNPYFGPEHHFSDLWPLFRNASVIVTGHYHYVIIAAISGCPFVPLSANNHKMSGVCEQLGWERTMPFDVTWLGPVISEICQEAAELVGRRDVVGSRLATRATDLGKLALRTGEWVRDVVGAESSDPGTPRRIL